MKAECHRYFIELQPPFGHETPRHLENTLRRANAENFVLILQDWIDENDLGDKVAALSVTAFGQVYITCEHEVMNLIREQDILNITAIRQSGFRRIAFNKPPENRRAG